MRCTCVCVSPIHSFLCVVRCGTRHCTPLLQMQFRGRPLRGAISRELRLPNSTMVRSALPLFLALSGVGEGRKFAPLVRPIEDLEALGKKCGWGRLGNLPNLEVKSSMFADNIDVRVDKCGHRSEKGNDTAELVFQYSGRRCEQLANRRHRTRFNVFSAPSGCLVPMFLCLCIASSTLLQCCSKSASRLMTKYL